VKLCTACIFTVNFSASAAQRISQVKWLTPVKLGINACPASALFQCSLIRSDAVTPPPPMKNARRAAAAGHKTTQRRRRPPGRRRTALIRPFILILWVSPANLSEQGPTFVNPALGVPRPPPETAIPPLGTGISLRKHLLRPRSHPTCHGAESAYMQSTASACCHYHFDSTKQSSGSCP